MQLWLSMTHILWQLRGGFSRTQTFLWFCVAVFGFCVRGDQAGVTSFVRALGLREQCYDSLRGFFHSSAIKLELLTVLWVATAVHLLPLLRVNGRLLLVADGIKVPKEGRKMPGVKCLHQDSQSNAKAEYIMGHSCQAISAIAEVGDYSFAVPLTARIHEGIVLSNAHRKTLFDKLLTLLGSLKLTAPWYLIADAYYANQAMVQGALASGNQLISRVKNNAVAYEMPATKKKRGRGRPALYGKKVHLRTYFESKDCHAIKSPIYGEKETTIHYSSADLLWRPVGHLIRFVSVTHPVRGSIILMSTDLSLAPEDIIKLYALRFKIEVSFKAQRHTLGVYSYHFWSDAMNPQKHGDGDQYLHRATEEYRSVILSKVGAYHAFIQTGIIAHGILLYLASTKTSLVWHSFGSWLRTIRPGVLPSEQVVMLALRNTLPHFLLTPTEKSVLVKFLHDRMDPERSLLLKLAA